MTSGACRAHLCFLNGDLQQLQDGAGRQLWVAGLQVVQPPEDWLFKVYVDDAMVDVLFRAGGDPVSRERLEHVDQIEVGSVRMPVLTATELMVDKLNALEEHAADFGAVVPVARAVREQVDWAVVAKRTADNPFAAALLFLLERLEVQPERPEGGAS